MAIKSVIDIPVNDQAFKNFVSMFEKYQAALREMPAEWKAVAEEASKAGTVFDQTVTAMLTQSAIVKGIEQSEKQQAEAAEKKRKSEAAAARSGFLHWKDMARTTRDVAGNIIRATESLLKWTALTSVFTGLLGAGGLYGINRMATSVAGGRRSSLGLGLNYGEQKAFGIDYGQVVEPGAFLGSVNQALHSWSDKAGFFGAGMSPNELKGTTGEVGDALLGHLKTIADNTNPAGLADVMKARSLDQFVSLEDMMRLRAMSPAEFQKVRDQYKADSSKLNLGRDAQDAWTKFMQQMDRAGTEIQNVFAEGLKPLAPRLSAVSEGFVKVAESIGKSPVIAKWMDDLAGGLDRFSAYIGTPEFQSNVETFVKGVGDLAASIVSALKWLGIIKDPEREKRKAEYEQSHRATSGAIPLPTGGLAFNPSLFMNRGGSDVGSITVSGRHVDNRLPMTVEGPRSPANSSTESEKGPRSPASSFTEIEKSRGLPAGFLNALYGAESSYGKNLLSPKGAVGPFQLMPDTAKAYGVKDSNNLDESARGAGHLLQDLMGEFKGDIAKVIAAYNWGSGHVEQVTAQYGDKWRDHIPAETTRELVAVLRSLGQSSRTTVEIQNNSGANVITSTSQLAAVPG